MIESQEWINYSTTKPPIEGPYEWKMSSVGVSGLTIIVAAHFRKRGAGYEDVLSPSFDYWDGYRIHIPKNLFWREASPLYAAIKRHEDPIIGIEGLEFAPCIYCQKIPTLKSVQRSSGNGIIIGGGPHEDNCFWLECCRWGNTPHLSDPREIERIRREAFARRTQLCIEETQKV